MTGPLGALLACAAFAAALAGAGLAAAPWARLPRRPAGLAWLLAALGGAGLWGIGLLGLALVRLWFAVPVAAAVAIGLAAAIRLWTRLPRPTRPPSLVMVAVGLPVLYGLAWALLPEVETDAFIYHLAAPGQWWLAHGWYADRAAPTWKLPLPFETLFAWSACLGDDRVAKLLCVAAIPAVGTAIVVLAGPGVGGAVAAWLLLGSGSVLLIAGKAMNDLAALAWFAAALAAQDACRKRDGDARCPSCLPWIFFGFAIAAKYTLVLAAPAVLWWGSLRGGGSWRPSRRSLVAAWPALVPLLPWWVNSFLAYGNPFYFVLIGVLPALGWDESSRMVFRDFVAGLAPRATATVAGALWRVGIRLLRDAPGLLMVVPLAVLPRSMPAGRRVALAGFGLAWLAARVARFDRFGLPADLLLAVAVGMLVPEGGAGRRGRTGLLILLAASGLAPFVRAWPGLAAAGPVRAAIGLEEPAAARARLWGQLADIQGVVNDDLRPRRILLAAEMRIHGFEAEVFATQTYGHPPLVWALAREARDPADLRKRVRQLGVTHVAYNFVTGAYQARMALPYAWEDRALVLYREFVRSYLRIVAVPSRVDHVQGGFYVYRILTRPEPGPALVYYLPGAEGVLAPAEALQILGNPDAAAREVARLGRLLPDVGHLRNVIGYSFRTAGRWEAAYRMYGPGIRAGMVDDENWSGFATAASGLGKTDEAVAAARRAWDLYVSRRPEADRMIAMLEHDRGERSLRAGRPKEAEASYVSCLASLARLPKSKELEDATLFATLRLADAYVRQGRRREAQEKLDEAALVRPKVLRTPEAREVLRRIGDRP